MTPGGAIAIAAWGGFCAWIAYMIFKPRHDLDDREIIVEIEHGVINVDDLAEAEPDGFDRELAEAGLAVIDIDD